MGVNDMHDEGESHGCMGKSWGGLAWEQGPISHAQHMLVLQAQNQLFHW